MKRYFLEIFRQKWRLVAVVLTLILLNVVLSLVISVYQLPALAEMQARWSALRRQAAGSGQVDANALYQQGTVDLEKLQERIPDKREFVRILNDVLDAAANNAVEIEGISYKPSKLKEEPLLSYQLSFSVNGSYAAVKSYLSDLQSNPELMVIDTVTFSNSDLLAESVVMDLQMTVYLREGA